MKRDVVNIIGGGYAGGEAALTLANFGVEVHLFDCPRNDYPPLYVEENYDRLLEELKALGCLTADLINCNFLNLKSKIFEKLIENPNIMIFENEINEISLSEPTIIATGAHTSEKFFEQIESVIGKMRTHRHLPIFPQFSNNIKDLVYKDFYYLPVENTVISNISDFLKKFHSDNDCLENWAENGKELLKAKLFKPVCINGQILEHCLKFKLENDVLTLLNFHTEISSDDQVKLFNLIPQLKDADIVRFGAIEKSTFVDPYIALNSSLQSNNNQNLFFAGEIILAKNELEAILTGHFAALNILNYIQGRKLVVLPQNTLVRKCIDKFFSFHSFKNDVNFKFYDIINSVNREKSIDLLKNFKEDFNARISRHYNLCSKKRW